MNLRGLLTELRHRGVLKVAAAYAAIGWVALQGLSLLFQNFGAPDWVLKVTTTFVLIGFPIACLMAWGFDISAEGVRPVQATAPLPSVRAEQGVAATSAGAGTAPSIAVLPFVDMSAERDQQYLGDGIAEELLNALAAIEGLNVAARTSSFSFHGKDVTMKEIGAALHVRHVLEGSVRRSGRKLRVTAQLIDVETGFHLYSQAYDREAQDIFDIQNEIAREIVWALMPRLGIGRDALLVRQGTTSLEAYNLRLQARPWLTAPYVGTADAAVGKLEQAVKLDPQYWDAWGDLAYVKGYMASWTGDTVPLMVDAEHAAAIALFHSPTNVIALLWRAFVSMAVKHDPDAAAEYYERARRAGADESVWAFQKAYCHDAPLGRFDDAIAALKEAERRDPLAYSLKGALMEMYLAAGRTADALAVAVEMAKGEIGASDTMTGVGRTFVAAGELSKARDVLARYRQVTGEDHLTGTLLEFEINLASGELGEVQRRVARLLAQSSQDPGISSYVIGEGFKALGDYDQMISWWTRAVERHETWSLSLMPARNRRHPVVGKDPRFIALLKRMGLEGRQPVLQRTEIPG